MWIEQLGLHFRGIGPRKIGLGRRSCDNRPYARHSFSGRSIYFPDDCMGMRTTEYGCIEHVGEHDIGGVNGVAANSFVSIHSRKRPADDFGFLPRLRVLVRQWGFRDWYAP